MPELPPGYWEAISRLQRAEIGALRTPGSETGEALAAARAEVTRLEAISLPDTAGRADSYGRPGSLLRRVRAALPRGAALLSFQLGQSGSWLWAVDSAGMDLRPLPPRRIVEKQARAVSDLLRNDAPESITAGAAFYRMLFGGLDARFRADSRWLLALDGALFEVPFAALPDEITPGAIEKEIADIEAALLNPAALSPGEINELSLRHSERQRQTEELLNQWEAANEELEQEGE
jgi:hypothetical protein